MTGQNDNTDFSNGKVYVLISPNCDLFYYGSTVEELSVRYSHHKSHRNCTSRKIIDAGDAEIYEIETYPCSCLEELEDREAFYILNDWDGCVNKTVPGSIRRSGGNKAYLKKYNAIPENKAKQKAHNDKPEVKARKKARSQKPEVKSHVAEKIPCNVCGCMISRGAMPRHKKTKKCQKFLKNI